MTTTTTRDYLRWSALFAGAAVVFAAQEYVARGWRGQTPSLQSIMLGQPIAWAAWALLTPTVIVPIVRAFPLARGPGLSRDVAAHAMAMIALAATQTAIVALTSATIAYGISPPAIRDIFVDRTLTAFGFNALIYLSIVAVERGRRLALEARERSLEAARLEARAARAELIVLYGQLQPHFLFNALNGIAELTHSDPEKAAQMIRSLSRLLRASIDGAGTLTTTLGSEIEFVRRYVELQQMRFQQFEFSLRVDPEAMNAVVPPLLLQPLMENAIKYTVGVSGSGKASLTVDRRSDRLAIVVRDDGPGFGTDVPAGPGIGLSTTRERLDRLFGKTYHLALSPAGVPGAVVALDIPYRTEAIASP